VVNSRDINDLVSEAQMLCVRWKAQCFAIGLPVKITSTLRDKEYQEYLYEQGRSRPGNIVTWTKNSRHLPFGKEQKSRAWDFVILDKDSHLVWDLKADVNEDNKKDYEQLAKLARDMGLKAGADFGDFCHIELDLQDT
jgi:peptidoglycan L-alanyl-D-glutamate endopeptidase CwlK